MAIGPRESARREGRFREAARAAGLKLTRQRLEIFREVAGREDHPGAEAVFRAVRPRLPRVSLDTVYRNLWLLADLGLVTTLAPRRESARFDAHLEPHHHFLCLRCGRARDFLSPACDALRLPPAVARMGRVVATRVEARGVCAECARDGERRSPAAASRREGRRRRGS